LDNNSSLIFWRLAFLIPMLQACWIEWVAHVKKHVLLSSKLAPLANDM